jgi:hypothetical protein
MGSDGGVVEGEFVENKEHTIQSDSETKAVVPVYRAEINHEAHQQLEQLSQVRRQEGWITESNLVKHHEGERLSVSYTLSVDPINFSQIVKVNMKTINPGDPESSLGSIVVNQAVFGKREENIVKPVVAEISMRSVVEVGGNTPVDSTVFLTADGQWAEQDHRLDSSGSYAGKIRPLIGRKPDMLERYVTSGRYPHGFFSDVQDFVQVAEEVVAMGKLHERYTNSDIVERSADMRNDAQRGSFSTQGGGVNIHSDRKRSALGLVGWIGNIAKEKNPERQRGQLKVDTELQREFLTTLQGSGVFNF